MEKLSNSLAKIIGLKIAYYRKLKGYTQLQLAQKINISLSYISKIECGCLAKCVSLPVLMMISKELNVSVSQLICENIEKK